MDGRIFGLFFLSFLGKLFFNDTYLPKVDLTFNQFLMDI